MPILAGEFPLPENPIFKFQISEIIFFSNNNIFFLPPLTPIEKTRLSMSRSNLKSFIITSPNEMCLLVLHRALNFAFVWGPLLIGPLRRQQSEQGRTKTEDNDIYPHPQK